MICHRRGHGFIEVFREIRRETEVNVAEETGIENLVPNLEEEIVDEDMSDLFKFL